MSYFKARQIEVHDRGYTILEGFGDPTNRDHLGDVELPFNRPENVPQQTKAQLFEKVDSTFDAEEALECEDGANWRPIFNHAVEEEDEADRQRNVARFSTTWNFTMEYMNKPGEDAWMSKFR